MEFLRSRGLWIALIALAAGFAIWLAVSPEPFTLVVLYDEVGSLKKDDPVSWKDFEIGRVEGIQPLVENRVGVTIRIKEDYVKSITEGTEFILRQPSLLGLIGSNAVEVVPPQAPGRPLSRGEKVRGTVPQQTTLWESGRRWTAEKLRQVANDTSALVEELRSSPMREEAVAALEELDRLASERARQAKEGMERFGRDHQKELDGALRKLEQIRDEMRRQGGEKAARRIEEHIEKIRKP